MDEVRSGVARSNYSGKPLAKATACCYSGNAVRSTTLPRLSLILLT